MYALNTILRLEAEVHDPLDRAKPVEERVGLLERQVGGSMAMAAVVVDEARRRPAWCLKGCRNLGVVSQQWREMKVGLCSYLGLMQ